MFNIKINKGILNIHNLVAAKIRTELVLILAATRLWIFRIPLLILMLNIFDVGYQAVWINMVISNFGAIALGFILYTFVDYRPKINKMHQKIKQEISKA